MNSIRVRMIVMFTALTSATLAAFGMYAQSQLSDNLERRFAQRTAATVARLTHSLPKPMWDYDRDATFSIIKAELLQDEVVAVQVFAPQGELFTGAMRNVDGALVAAGRHDTFDGPSEKAEVLYSNVGLGTKGSSDVLGTVQVYFSRAHIDEALAADAQRRITEILVVDVLLVIILSLSLQMVFSPLKRLRDALFDLAHRDDGGVHELPRETRTEFAEVVDGFNQTQRKLKRVLDEHKQAEAAARTSAAQTAQAYAELKEAQQSLVQAEKLASLGGLVAGVAHEINNPIGFVNSNIGTLGRYVDELLVVLDAYAELHERLPAELRETVEQRTGDIDLDYLREDLPPLLKESRDGLERVKKIVQDLKDFSRMGDTETAQADLNQCLDSTLNMVANEIKYKAEVVKCYGELPLVPCVASQINQVLMNLLVNAAQAIEENGVITLTTGREGDQVFISVRDTGCGIPEEHLSKIFDPFYTTKPIGTGTGLGLSVSYSIIEKHGGHFEVKTEIGKGTEFRIWLPIRASQPEAQPGQTAAA